MNRSRITSLLSISIGAVLLSGLIVPGFTQQAFAGTVSILDDVNPPNVGPNAIRGQPGSFNYVWVDPGIGDNEQCFTGPSDDRLFEPSGTMSLFADPPASIGGPGLSGPSDHFDFGDVSSTGDETFDLNNWEDKFLIKRIRIHQRSSR